MTSALGGAQHKTMIIMNKCDRFSSVFDFARAYGALCWNLSKVMPRKDIPPIYTMSTPTLPNGSGAASEAAVATVTPGSGVPHSGMLQEAVGELERSRAEVSERGWGLHN